MKRFLLPESGIFVQQPLKSISTGWKDMNYLRLDFAAMHEKLAGSRYKKYPHIQQLMLVAIRTGATTYQLLNFLTING
jgi:hypothetical protein